VRSMHKMVDDMDRCPGAEAHIKTIRVEVTMKFVVSIDDTVTLAENTVREFMGAVDFSYVPVPTFLEVARDAVEGTGPVFRRRDTTCITPLHKQAMGYLFNTFGAATTASVAAWRSDLGTPWLGPRQVAAAEVQAALQPQQQQLGGQLVQVVPDADAVKRAMRDRIKFVTVNSGRHAGKLSVCFCFRNCRLLTLNFCM